MARTARFVVPDCPHHVTQRGNRRQRIFFQPADYRVYRHMLGEHLRRWKVRCWAYCLMPNHVHLVVTPSCEDGLSRAIGQAHRRYASYINARLEAVGHLFQGRFGSVAMDEAHFIAAARYVSLNPVRAGLAADAEQWPWSSVRAHLAGRDDGLVTTAPLLERVGDFDAWLIDQPPGWSEAADALRAAERTGRPVGDRAFLERIGRR